jgi:hypothetical protein
MVDERRTKDPGSIPPNIPLPTSPSTLQKKKIPKRCIENGTFIKKIPENISIPSVLGTLT